MVSIQRTQSILQYVHILDIGTYVHIFDNLIKKNLNFNETPVKVGGKYALMIL